MMALAAANSPRIHEMNPSLPSGIQFPGATLPGGIAIGKGRKLVSFFFWFRYQTELIALFRQICRIQDDDIVNTGTKT